MVIVGAGIGGSALAYVLAQADLSVVLLEKTRVHKDVVRGEWLAPWGVQQAQALGLLDVYMEHGAHRPKKHLNYSDLSPPEQAEQASLVFTDMGVPEPLCLGHPATCNLLNTMAQDAGAELVRGIRALRVVPGLKPHISFVQDGRFVELSPRWVVGADGRNGVVASQIGANLLHDEEHHLFSGMLVEGADDWPEDVQVIATEGDVNVLAFPQGGGKVRVYLGWPKEDRARLVGPSGPQRFLQAWQLDSVPYAHAIAQAKPISPCIAYPNFDAWADRQVVPGVVLIGDAAGRNDPIIGQGLSITHADVRQVADAFLGNSQWDTDIFQPYVEERAERMRRLRIVARLTSLKESAFGDDGFKLRHDIHTKLDQQPELGASLAAGFVGPMALPDEVFGEAFSSALVGQPIWNQLP